MLFRSLLLGWRRKAKPATVHLQPVGKSEHRNELWGGLSKAVILLTLMLLSAGVIYGAWALISLLWRVPLTDPSHADWLHILLGLVASFGRVMLAIMLGTAWTLPAGILIGLNPKWSQRLQPVVQVVASFPAPMLFPWVLIILALLHVPFWIGCVSLLLLGTQWYLLFNVIAGAMAIPSELREAASVYHLGSWFTWRKLYIPAVFPNLVTGLVTAAGGAWNATIVAEYFKMGDMKIFTFGLGTIIVNATTYPENFPVLAAGALTMAVFVVTFNRLVWKRLNRTAESRYSLNV